MIVAPNLAPITLGVYLTVQWIGAYDGEMGGIQEIPLNIMAPD